MSSVTQLLLSIDGDVSFTAGRCSPSDDDQPEELGRHSGYMYGYFGNFKFFQQPSEMDTSIFCTL